MNYADYAAASTHLILERHRLHQTLATQSAPRRATLVDVCAEAVARAPRNPSDAPRLQHLPEHLLARIVSFTPHVALRRPIDSIAQRDTAVWPEALRAAYTDAYVHALARDACLAIGSPHPDATSVQHFHTELFEMADAHLAPSQRLAHIDLGRILLRPTLREEAQERRFWPSLLRFLNTPHGIVAQPSEPTHASRLLARQRGDILASLKQVWTQIASEYDARTAAPHDSIGPYTTALGDAVSLAPHWDYDLLRLSVTWAAPANTRRIPARGLPHLRAALSAAAAGEGVSPLVRAQLLQLHQHLSVFDVSMLAQSSPRDLRVAGLSYPSTKMAASIRQAHTYVRRFEAASNDAESDATYRASVALIALWADSQSLRACR